MLSRTPNRRWLVSAATALSLLLAATIAACAGETTSGNDSTSGAPGAMSGDGSAGTNPVSSEAGGDEYGIGDLVRVGSLDLTVHEVEPVDTTPYNMFNDANLRVRITATNSRGDADEEYNLSQLAFKLVDTQGIAHDAAFVCADCPDEISSVDLVRGGSVTGYVYFEFPAGREPVQLIYEPLFSLNKARIDLR